MALKKLTLDDAVRSLEVHDPDDEEQAKRLKRINGIPMEALAQAREAHGLLARLEALDEDDDDDAKAARKLARRVEQCVAQLAETHSIDLVTGDIPATED